MDESDFNTENSKIETAEEYVVQSELNDMRQHANKIIQGIKKLDGNDARRAIWELFQNAIDLSEECHININLTEDTFEFSHNGEPFTAMTLDCLFKQVSSKTLEEKKEEHKVSDPIGQYGTGFMSTHIFGKELEINGALLKGNGYIPLTEFVIDRSTENWKQIAWRIRELKKKVSFLLAGKEITPPPFPATTFIYTTATKSNREYAVAAISSLRAILPYVMTLNPKLYSVTVKDKDGEVTEFKKCDKYEKNGINVRPISINGEKQEVCYISHNEDEIVVILPLNSELSAFSLDEKLPRLFLYYPLVGTQNFGINFIIHSRNFQPTESRNGLFLKSDNDLNEKDEAINSDLLEKASVLIFEFLRISAIRINNPIHLATINFNLNNDSNMLLDDYYKQLKEKWIAEFKQLKLVQTTRENIEPEKTLFLSDVLLQEMYSSKEENEKSFTAIYQLAIQFWKNIPERYLIKEWTKIFNEWDINLTQYITEKSIVNKIQEASNLSAFENHENLKEFYKYLIAIGQSGEFNALKLLPNIKGEFRQLTGKEGLNSCLNIPQVLIEIADVIMPDIPKRHINPDFKFSLELDDYSRKNFTADINDFINKIINEKTESSTISERVLHKLIQYCKISTTPDSTSVPNQLMKLISRYYGQGEELIVIQPVKDDELDVRVPQRRLLRMFLNDISKKGSSWVTENLEFLKNIISLGTSYTDYEELFLTVPVFPSQLDELRFQNTLSIDDEIPPEIKDLFDKVIKPDLPIRASLVKEGFEDFLKNKERKTTIELAEKIERVLFDDKNHHPIGEHPFKKEIMNIIEKIKQPDSGYDKYFKLIYSMRSTILAGLAEGEDTFSILSLEPKKIKKLADLGNNPEFEKIIKLGEDALNRIKQDRALFEYKFVIGTRIEAVIRERLSHVVGLNVNKPDTNTLEADYSAEDEQKGQDIIIYFGDKPVYFVEVKSRWVDSTSFRISKTQTIKAFDNSAIYSLITVDMSKSMLGNKYNITDISEIEDVIKVNTDIGSKLNGELIIQYLDSNNPEAFHIDGDFRTYVPLSYINSGSSFKQFEDHLVKILQPKNDHEPNQ